MRAFFKQVLASTLGSLIGFILSFFFIFVILIGLIAGLASKGNQKETKVDPNSILIINLDYPIADRTSDNLFENISFSSFKPNRNLGLNDIIKNIRKAAKDDNIKGIYLQSRAAGGGYATVKAIRDALQEFKESGKFIIAYSDVMTQKTYYLSSVADKIYINPMGLIELSGFNTNIAFLKGMLEKLEIELQIFYAGKFKSATEPFRLDKMSDENRLQISEYLFSIQNQVMEEIAEARSLNRGMVDSIAYHLLVRKPEDAVELGLVDELKFFDQILDELKERTGTDAKKKLPQVTLASYDNTPETDAKSKALIKDKIAIVFAEGDIVDGDSEDGSIGSDSFSKLLRKVREDEEVKGVVLRVNSPGGSALASEIILREVELIKKEKPIVVSMGNVAASGGYYISAYADRIFAEPYTITGSIGVFGLLPNLQGFFNKKLGITFDGVKTGKFSDLGTPERPLTAEERLIIQEGVDRIYETFKNRVVVGRNMELSRVEEIAQGRIYSGMQALELGLVDELGNLDDAVKYLTTRLELKEYKLKEYPESRDPLEKFIEELSGKGEASVWAWMKQKDAYGILQQVRKVEQWQGIQTRMPFELEVN